MFETIKMEFGRDTIVTVRRFIQCFITIARQQKHLHLNHRLKEHKLLTPSLRVKPHLKSRDGYRLARRQSFQNLSLRILTNHKTIRKSLKEMVFLGHKLSIVISEDILSEIIKYAEDKAQRSSDNLKWRLDLKFQRLLPRHY